MSDDSSIQDDLERTTVTVVDVERYIIDPLFLQQTGLSSQHAYDAYDITVADSQHRRKVVLSCALNHLVQKRKIRAGSLIRLTRVNLRYDETTLNGPVIPVVEDVTVVDQQDAAAIDDLARLPWCSRNNAPSREPRPLASGRGYYIDVWSSADVVKTADNFEVEVSISPGNVTSQDLYSLREVATRWHSIQAAKPRLLLRVMRRSRLIHYARPSTRDKWPFQLQLVVGDETGCCVAVFWNVMAPRFLNYVQEGSILLLRSFIVKQRFRMPEHHLWQPPGLPWYDVDINVNAHHPAGEVTLLDPAVVEDLRDAQLPLPVTNFVTRRQLSRFPDGYICDVAGLLTFVGAVQREKLKGKPGHDCRFWIKRWVHVRDSTSEQPIIIELYRGVQKEEFEEGLDPGQFLVCRNMRIIHSLDQLQASRQPRHVYVTSSRDTQIYVHGADEDVDYPFASGATLRSAQRFAHATPCDVSDKETLHQVLFSFPPQPTSLDSFSAEHENMELTPSDGWMTFVENLSYRERTHIAVQARLMTVTFHRGRMSHRQSKRAHRAQNQQQVTSTSDGVQLGLNPTSSECAFNFEGDTFFSIQWRGLNANAVLNTVKPCSLRSCPSDLTLDALLSGAFDSRPGEANVYLREEAVRSVVGSVTSQNSSSLPRYLVLLDVFCLDGETALMEVNRAFPLVDHR